MVNQSEKWPIPAHFHSQGIKPCLFVKASNVSEHLFPNTVGVVKQTTKCSLGGKACERIKT